MKVLNKIEMQSAIDEAEKAGKSHYVYALVRSDDGRIFYIGKGVGQRVFSHERLIKGNPHKNAIIKKCGIGGYILFDSFFESKDAFSFERDLIAHYGIENLANIGRGGEGQDPDFAREFAKNQWSDPNSKIRKAITSDEYRKAASERFKKMHSDPEKNKAHREAVRSEEHRNLLSKITKKRMEDPENRRAAGNGSRGRVFTDEQKKALSIAQKEAYKNNPNAFENKSKTMKAVSNTDEQREKRRLASLARWAKPGEKEKAAAAMKKRMEDSEFKIKALSNLKR